jgi:hypothetical protein
MQSLTRSARLRKYEIAYEECIKKTKLTQVQPLKKSRSRRCKLSIEVQKNPVKKSRSRLSIEVQPNTLKKSRSRPCKQLSPPNIDERNIKKKSLKKSPGMKKPLNLYQQFVKKESQKSIYKGISAKERMISISKEWNTQKIK